MCFPRPLCPTCKVTLADPHKFPESCARTACEHYENGQLSCLDYRKQRTAGTATVCKHASGMIGHQTNPNPTSGLTPSNRSYTTGTTTGATTVCRYGTACRDLNCRYPHPNGRPLLSALVGHQTPNPTSGLTPKVNNTHKPAKQVLGGRPPVVFGGYPSSSVVFGGHPSPSVVFGGHSSHPPVLHRPPPAAVYMAGRGSVPGVYVAKSWF